MYISLDFDLIFLHKFTKTHSSAGFHKLFVNSLSFTHIFCSKATCVQLTAYSSTFLQHTNLAVSYALVALKI